MCKKAKNLRRTEVFVAFLRTEGKEKRKARPSQEGKLGVEGMSPDVLLTVLRRAGATFEGEDGGVPSGNILTKADFFAFGLSGGADSGGKVFAAAVTAGFEEARRAGAASVALFASGAMKLNSALPKSSTLTPGFSGS